MDVECEEKLNLLQDHWLKLSTFFRKVYHTILDGEKPPDEYKCHMDIVKEFVAFLYNSIRRLNCKYLNASVFY